MTTLIFPCINCEADIKTPKKKPSFPLEQKKVYKFLKPTQHSTSSFVRRIKFYTRRWPWIFHRSTHTLIFLDESPQNPMAIFPKSTSPTIHTSLSYDNSQQLLLLGHLFLALKIFVTPLVYLLRGLEFFWNKF